jgi:ribosomal protein L37AE/L43A
VIQDPPKTRRKSARGGSTVHGSRRRSRKPEVQFATSEEHRCPYCLELVGPDDPRGVVECKVCHTLHHADCWAITGVCQVPHLNS